MQNDAFKRFSKDLQEVLVIPVNYINKKTKKSSMAGGNGDLFTLSNNNFSSHPQQPHHHHPPHHHSSKKPIGLSGLTTSDLRKDLSGGQVSPYSSLTSDSVSLHNFSLSTLSKGSLDENPSFTSSNGSAAGYFGLSQQQQLQQQGGGGNPQFFHQQQQQQQHKLTKASSFLRSPLSPGGFNGSMRIYPKLEEPALVHCPPSVATLDQFSPERQNWVRECPNQPLLTGAGIGLGQLGGDVLKSERAWDVVATSPGDGRPCDLQSSAGLVASGRDFLKTGYYNPNEATGLALVKLMQVSNRATSKLFDIECNLRVGNVERTSHPARSFKDNPGNTATMNEVFLFDVEEAFQLEIEVTGTPIATKFGTMAGFSNTQSVNLGYLHLPIALESLEKSVRTYKLRRTIHMMDGSQQPLASAAAIKAQSKEKVDCEIVVMIGLHVLEEPVDDRSWENEVLFEGHLTVMTRGLRMAAWKRYWAVLQGNAVKLYDVEYQTKRDPITTISLAHILSVQPPDYDKVDVGSNGFVLVISPTGIDMSSATEEDLTSNMDNNIYAFTDSAHLHESWNLQLERAMVGYREGIARRDEILEAKRNRRQRRSGAGGGGGSGGVEAVEEEEVARVDLIDLRFVS
ncbi:hypothetical protein KI688_001333 [Linnemannia hyalina]|uniref:PH domain-containing protein n=1 Tax=Linnemannia hyalina TaxID=64524 RepID=A0A9P8BRK2_9FUNG|nr:hypothetical protein KI688_001333 [Linnemannia hyalina]